MLPRRQGHCALPADRPEGRGARSSRISLVAGLVAVAVVIGIPIAQAGDSVWQPSSWTGPLAGAPVPGEGLPPAAVPGYPVALPPTYDVAAQYEGQAQCDPPAKPGTQRLADLIKATYGADQTVWIPRSCEIGGQSEHKEGRALDWMTSVRNAQQRANAETFLNWLLGPDQFGTPYGNAVRLGVMYIGWNDRIWRGYDIERGWTELKGCFSKPEQGNDTVCHRNHIHISLTWDGATATGSFWDGTPIDVPFCKGQSSTATTGDSTPAGEMVAITPFNALNTRAGVGAEGRCRLLQDRYSGDSNRIYVKVTGVGGVPATGVTGVTINVAALGSNSASRVRVWSPGQRASQTVVNAIMNGDTTGTATLPVSSEGTIVFATTSGATDLSVDVIGYYTKSKGGAGGSPELPVINAPAAPAPNTPIGPVDFFPVGSIIGYESTTDGALQPGEERTVNLAGVPGDATSALIFITSKDATSKGSVRIGRTDKSASAKFRFPRAAMHKAVMLVPVSGGAVRLAASKKPAVSLRVEVLGYGTGASPSTAIALSPRSVFAGSFAAGEIKTYKVANHFGLPKVKKLKAVLLRVQTKKSTADGTVSVYAAGGQPPATRSAPVVANTRYAALVLAPVGADGHIMVTSSVAAAANATIVGYVR